MIKYDFYGVECKIEFKDFLSLVLDNDVKNKIYGSDFISFKELYEFIDKNINKITHILFDNYEYYLDNGKLHNLYGPAIVRYNVESQFLDKVSRFYIDGKLVYDNINNLKGCRNLYDFNNNEIFHYEEITNTKSGINPLTGVILRRKEGVDYNKYNINLSDRINIDQRCNKLKKLNKKSTEV